MNWIKALTESIDYMESHLDQEMKVADVAKVALSSPFHYQRMFFMLTGMSVQEYIRKRRLSLAAKELMTSDIKVIDVALKYGYESSEAFSRAFKKIHGATPTIVRLGKATSKVFPKLTIQLTVKGDVPMDYRIERKEGFSFYGMTRNVSTVDGQNFVEVPKFWQDVMADGSFENLVKTVKPGSYSFGVCMPMDPEKDEDFDYVIGFSCDDQVAGYDNYSVEAADWAIFEVRGPVVREVQKAWKRIFAEWFPPATGFKHAFLPEIEVYHEGDVNSEDYLTEIWIPIIKD